MRPSDSLAAKLIIAIGGLLIAGGIVVGLLFYKYESDSTLGNLRGHSRFASSLILGSLKSDMLKGNSTGISNTLGWLAGSNSDIRELTVYSTDGKAVYSTRPAVEGRVLAAGGPEMQALSQGMELTRLEEPAAGQGRGARILSRFTPIENEPSCRNASCHYHSPEAPYLGMLVTRMGSAHIEGMSRKLGLTTLILGLLFIVIISGCLFIINYLLVTRPVAMLEKGMRTLAEGNFDMPLEIRTTDEIGRLARNFNTMAHDIQRYKNKLENWAKELENEVEQKTAAIKEAQDQLVNAEKLASLGRLAAGVAHEINNPLTGIVTFAHLMLERTPEDRVEDREDLEMIIEQADRCTKIVKGLLGFSRKGSSEKTLCSLNDLIESCYSMVRNQSAFHDVQVALNLAQDVPQIYVDPNQIQQVILNLFTNASDAMNSIGSITISTRAATVDSTLYVEMTFTDTGPGILPEHLGRILEPFFTTKAVGKGTGLGLPVSYGIIKRHGGELHVTSQVGRGTTFTMRLPSADAKAGQDPSSTGQGNE